MESYGKTNEGRSLQLAFISSPENLKNIEKIRDNHLKNSGSKNGELNSDKAIVWLSYNVHGNESSSTEAAMKKSTDTLSGLKENVIIGTLIPAGTGSDM